jgi:uncharacterized tellurite resistance protein B-like protein
MFDHIFGLLTGRGADPALDDERQLRVCVAALLVEAARMDDRFDDAERQAVQRILGERYGLSPWETAELLGAAERAVDQSAQLFRFTDAVVQRVPVEDRVRILEMLWEVAYADGVLNPEEDQLLRRIAGLIHVSDRDRALARQRVLQRLGKS